MGKRSYNRRSDDELIEEYKNQIQALETRIQQREREDMPVLKEFEKLKRKLGQFSQTCVDHGRRDLSNSTLAFMNTLERQAREVVARG